MFASGLFDVARLGVFGFGYFFPPQQRLRPLGRAKQELACRDKPGNARTCLFFKLIELCARTRRRIFEAITEKLFGL